MMPELVAVAGGAAIGAPCRYLLDRIVQSRHEQDFPWGTLVINLLGSAVLGGLLGSAAALPSLVLVTAGVGWCGAFTTYSTFALETVHLMQSGRFRWAVTNVLIQVCGGLALAASGFAVGRWLVG